MAKVMLVEDDNNLREIYQARLSAEGYQIVAAKDGEEALELAVKEKPDLILLDVMMPKVSGFELLDILRSTDGIKYTKVIMMTALSQAEDKERAEKLGANRYLIKSQVTLEDMAKAVHDVLAEDSAVPADTPGQESSPEQQLLTNAANTLSTAAPSSANPLSQTSGATPDFSTNDKETTATPVAAPADDNPNSDGVTIAKKKIINPINDPTKQKNNLNDLLAKEEASSEGKIGGTVTSADSYSNVNSNNDDDIPAGSPLNNPLTQSTPKDDENPDTPGGITV